MATRTVARRKRISRPFLGKRRLRTWRKKTIRDKLIRLLRKGSTIAKCQTATGLDYKDCYDSIILLHVYTGFGLSEDERGVISLIEE